MYLMIIWSIVLFLLFGLLCAYAYGECGQKPTLRDEAKTAIVYILVSAVSLSLLVTFGDVTIFGDFSLGHAMVLVMMFLWGFVAYAGDTAIIRHNFPE